MKNSRNRTSRTGSVLVLTTLCLIGLIGVLALAIDIGTIAVARTQCQNAADASAMAGARTITGTSSNNYNISSIPSEALTAASGNQVMGKNILAPVGSVSSVNSYTYQSGQVTLQVGSYAYTYNDSNPSSESFNVQIPRTSVNGMYPAYSAVQSTVTGTANSSFSNVFGVTSTNTSATALAVHRPRDVMVIMDLSGSMRFESLPGAFYDGTYVYPEWVLPRTVSFNPDPDFPKFGHYSDTATAALQATQNYTADVGLTCDLSNISYPSAAGPAIAADFYKNAVGVTPTASDVAFTAAPSSYSTTPGGDNFLTTKLNTTATYAQTVTQFNNNSTTTNPTFEVKGYAGYNAKFNGYTQGPSYWGKTFWVWPPAPPGKGVAAPPATVTDTTYKWYNNGSNDWRQKFFVAVNSATSVPSWNIHNTVLFNNAAPLMKTPGTVTSVTENGVVVKYTYRINYAAILYWLNQAPAPFPTTLQAGRIRYYGKMPDGTDNALNNRWWTTSPLPNDEQIWKDYIDFVLGFVSTGPGAYSNTNWGVNVSGIIGNGDYYTWSGSTVKLSDRPQPSPTTANPGGPYESGTTSAAAAIGAASVSVSGLGTAPIANSDYVIFNGDTAHPYLITNSNASTLNVSPNLTVAVAKNVTVQIYSPYMNYDDCPIRPRHQFWFGAMTFIDWLGNYELLDSNGYAHHWWPGNCHEAQAWACKVGLQAAINDIQTNHPNDYVGLTFFSTPMYSNGDNYGHFNRALVSLGQNYNNLINSLFFPPTTVTGTATEISPYDDDFQQVPRANGGTCPGMSFMIAYNQLSSSVNNLRLYASPQPSYRGDAGGMGRKGADRLVIFETDGFPNTRAYTNLVSAGSDSYYPIRIANPATLSSASNTEFPSGGGYSNTDVYNVVKQICASSTATPPGYSTTRRKANVYCLGYGSIFDPTNACANQTTALTFLQTIQFYGNTSADTNASNFPSSQLIYGTYNNRIATMQTAFKNIMQAGVQVSLLQ